METVLFVHIMSQSQQLFLKIKPLKNGSISLKSLRPVQLKFCAVKSKQKYLNLEKSGPASCKVQAKLLNCQVKIGLQPGYVQKEDDGC